MHTCHARVRLITHLDSPPPTYASVLTNSPLNYIVSRMISSPCFIIEWKAVLGFPSLVLDLVRRTRSSPIPSNETLCPSHHEQRVLLRGGYELFPNDHFANLGIVNMICEIAL